MLFVRATLDIMKKPGMKRQLMKSLERRNEECKQESTIYQNYDAIED